MSFRRFVYLVTDDAKRHNFSLRRIDMARFFFPKHERDRLLTGAPPLEEGRLPPESMKFIPPTPKFGNARMHFMLLSGPDKVVSTCNGSRTDDKVVVADQAGRILVYDSECDSVGTLCNLAAPKSSPISLTVGRGLYILDKYFHGSCEHCFERIMHDDPDSISDDDEWFRCVTKDREDLNCESLPPPPYVQLLAAGSSIGRHPGPITTYTVDGSGTSIWVSNPNLGTYSFDTLSRVWTKPGDWGLPFYGHAHYVSEHKLWFGLSSSYGEGYGDDAYMCASDLTVTPPTAHIIWGQPAPQKCINKWYYLVHLGRSRFCHARFYEIIRPGEDGCPKYVELTGLEVERCVEAGGKLKVVQHRSKRYSIDNRVMQWVL